MPEYFCSSYSFYSVWLYNNNFQLSLFWFRQKRVWIKRFKLHSCDILAWELKHNILLKLFKACIWIKIKQENNRTIFPSYLTADFKVILRMKNETEKGNLFLFWFWTKHKRNREGIKFHNQKSRFVLNIGLKKQWIWLYCSFVSGNKISRVSL